MTLCRRATRTGSIVRVKKLRFAQRLLCLTCLWVVFCWFCCCGGRCGFPVGGGAAFFDLSSSGRFCGEPFFAALSSLRAVSAPSSSRAVSAHRPRRSRRRLVFFSVAAFCVSGRFCRCDLFLCVSGRFCRCEPFFGSLVCCESFRLIVVVLRAVSAHRSRRRCRIVCFWARRNPTATPIPPFPTLRKIPRQVPSLAKPTREGLGVG